MAAARLLPLHPRLIIPAGAGVKALLCLRAGEAFHKTFGGTDVSQAGTGAGSSQRRVTGRSAILWASLAADCDANVCSVSGLG